MRGGQTTQIRMAPDINTYTSTENGVTSAPITTISATITIDDRTSKKDAPGVVLHESIHAGEAQADPVKFAKDAAAEKDLPHDQKPQEQRANQEQKAYSQDIKKAVKKIENAANQAPPQSQ